VAVVGREHELEAIAGLLEDVRSSRGRSLMLRGEVGIGKTRLIDEAVARADGIRVTRVTGIESEIELSFAGLHQLLAPFHQYWDELPGPQRSALMTALGIERGSPPDRFLLAVSVLSLLSDAGRVEPVLCVIDDAQWIDAVSLDTIAFVARRLDADAVGILGALRNTLEGRHPLDDLPSLELGRLSAEAASTLFEAALTTPAHGTAVERLVAEAAGNPLALLQFARDLSEPEHAEAVVGLDALTQPPPLETRLEATFRRQIGGLPTDTQRILLLAAAEPTGDRELLDTAAAGWKLAPDAIGPAEIAGLILGGEHVRFVHPLMRSAVYHAASSSDRRVAHAALAAAETGTMSERRAWHLSLSAVGHDDAIAEELAYTAEEMARNGRHLGAALLFERSARLTSMRESRAERLLAAGESYLLAGHDVRAEAVSVEVGAGLTGALGARARRMAGDVRLARGELAGAGELLLRAASEFANIGHRRSATESMFDAWWALHLAGGDLAGVASEQLASQTSEFSLVAEGTNSVVDLLLLGFIERDRGGNPGANFRAAVSQLRAGESPPPRAVPLLTVGWTIAAELWDWDSQLALAGRLVDNCRELGALPMLVNALAVRGMSQCLCGNAAEAVEAVSELRELAKGGQWFVPSPFAVLPALVFSGRETEAREVAAKLPVRWGAEPGVLDVAVTYLMAVLDIGAARYDEALKRITDLGEANPLMYGSLLLPEVALAAARTGQRRLAEAALSKLRLRVEQAGTPGALGVLARVRAALTDDSTADERYEEALALLETTIGRYELARTHLEYGELLRRNKAMRRAREQLRLAQEIFVAGGYEAFAARAEAELRAAGDRRQKQPVRSGASLTPQESRIAKLVASGATNREIAARLFVSPSTVDFHLRKIFAKLAVTNRVQLARRVLDEPPLTD
jgi:DNA-binding CsgD family transcriptional regulator